MSFFSRIKRLFWETPEEPSAPETEAETAPEPTAPPALLPPEPQPGPPAPSTQQPEEQELQQLVQAAELTREVPVDDQRVLQLVSRLVAVGRSRRAAELLQKLTGWAPARATLRLRLAELLYDLKELEEAVDLLGELTDDPEHRLRAHFLLGDFHGREGNREHALRHYETVLALDFKHPRARGRADELRRKLDRPVATAAPTIFGAEDLGPGGRFVLQRELGRGGGGTVYLALEQNLGREVAVKALHPHVASRQEARIHLFCEARIAAALRHPRIVTIYDLEESLNLVVMEYCSGGALSDHIAGAALRPSLALRRLAEITSVLDTVHRCGVIHRDLKPANLLLRGSTDTAAETAPLVLTDFGTAHAATDGGEEPAEAVGSLIYMAPEQRHGGSLDPRADLYACGVILIEMLLGHPPLSQQQAIAGAAILELTELWRVLSDLLPESVLELARSLVAPSAEDRPADAAGVTKRATALVHDLAEIEIHRGVLDLLQQRAGTDPAPEVTAWLQSSAQTLGL